MRGDRERIIDILEAIERIEKYATSGRDAFEREELIRQCHIIINFKKLESFS